MAGLGVIKLTTKNTEQPNGYSVFLAGAEGLEPTTPSFGEKESKSKEAMCGNKFGEFPLSP